MVDTLAHRGPDGDGVWVDAEMGIGFGHRRLAIVDLSDDGAQPMVSHDGRYVATFNGEVYNFVELRAELEAAGTYFVGHSDTEVMLAAIARWGVGEAMRRCDGQLALGLWDRRRRMLTLARDRFGKKPLYYVVTDGRLVFGSELKALMAVPGFSPAIDESAAEAYFRYGFVPGAQSILAGVRRVEPGTTMQFPTPAGEPVRTAFWSFDEAIAAARADPFTGDATEAEERLHDLLLDAVRMRQRVDVPFGAFLSGGIDSSLVAALMQEADREPVRTFTIGFADADYDEAHHAAAVADALGCNHTSVTLEPNQLVELAGTLPIVFDEPFADVSQVPTLLVSRLARERVTVCFTGDGGDEVFGGYHRHFLAGHYWRRLSAIPHSVRRAIPALAGVVGERALAAAFRGTLRNPTEKAAKTAAALGAADLDELYAVLLSHGSTGPAVPRDASPLSRPSAAEGLGAVRRMMAMDTVNYLPDDILVKADRASMSTSLELRCPLLDPRVLQLSWRLPDRYLIEKGQGKRLLQRLLARYLPRQLFERPKAGFGVPMADWLRGPLNEWAADVLLADDEDPWVVGRQVRSRWRAHQDRARDHSQWLWRVIMWKSWRQAWRV